MQPWDHKKRWTEDKHPLPILEMIGCPIFLSNGLRDLADGAIFSGVLYSAFGVWITLSALQSLRQRYRQAKQEPLEA